MKNIIIGFISLCFFAHAYPQGENLEASVLECRYQLSMQTDTTRRLNPITDEMVLRIGETQSQFFSWYTFYHDSLWADPNGQKLAEELTLNAFRTRDYSKMPTVKTTKDYIYKNYPEGKITTITKDFKVGFVYEETYAPQNWVIQDSIKQHLGYNCKKAECDFRGRFWTVWFTPDIPIKDGPWKLNGLPGLILEAYDSNRDYHYTLMRIDKKNLTPVSLYHFDKEPNLKTERKIYLNSLNKFLTGVPTEEIELIQLMIKNGKEQKYMQRAKRNMTYDFLERDYLLLQP